MYGNIAKMNNEILSQSSFYEKSIKFKNNKVDDKRLNFYFFNKPQLSMLPQTGIDFFNYYKGMGYCVGCDETFKINKVYLQPSNDLSSILAIKSDNYFEDETSINYFKYESNGVSQSYTLYQTDHRFKKFSRPMQKYLCYDGFKISEKYDTLIKLAKKKGADIKYWLDENKDEYLSYVSLSKKHGTIYYRRDTNE
jgi:hypothetical protein